MSIEKITSNASQALNSIASAGKKVSAPSIEKTTEYAPIPTVPFDKTKGFAVLNMERNMKIMDKQNAETLKALQAKGLYPTPTIAP